MKFIALANGGYLVIGPGMELQVHEELSGKNWQVRARQFNPVSGTFHSWVITRGHSNAMEANQALAKLIEVLKS